MKLLIFSISITLGYFLFGFYISQMDESVIPLELKPENPPGLYDYRGVINVQTDVSTGSLSPTQVADEAKVAGLDYLILTDQDRSPSLPTINGYHGSLLVMDEAEYSFLDSRLLLISGEKKETPDDPSQRNIFMTDLLSQKWSGHPDQLLILAFPFNHGPTWSGSFPTGLQGLEILNSKSMSDKAWEHSKLNVLWSFISYPFNPRYAFLRLFQDPVEEISLWDQVLKSHPLWGFAGTDANARAFPLADYLVHFPPYAQSFSIMSNHILLPTELTGNYDQDRGKIFSALKRGQFYAALDLLGDPRGFDAALLEQDHALPMGTMIKFHRGFKLRARLRIEPRDFYEIVLMKDGQRIATANSQELTYDAITPGIYRFFVRVSTPFPMPDGKKWITWIYTNPFFLLDTNPPVEYHH